jgi:hypothetical protein
MNVGATLDETGSAVLDRSTALTWSMVLAERLRATVADAHAIRDRAAGHRLSVPLTPSSTYGFVNLSSNADGLVLRTSPLGLHLTQFPPRCAGVLTPEGLTSSIIVSTNL